MEIEAILDQFLQVIHQLIDSHVPIQKITTGSRNWWNPEIRNIRQRMRTAERRWKRWRTLYDRTLFVNLRRHLRAKINHSKRIQWRLWCASFHQANPWQLLRYVKPRQAQAVETLEVDGEVITDSYAKASLLISTFFPSLPLASISHHYNVDSTWAKARPPGRRVVAPVSAKELKWACFRMRSSAAPGPDMLPIVILQRCFREICQLFQKLFTACLEIGFFPHRWKEAKVIALRKPGKSSYSIPRSYRPISLLNHMGKLLETIVNNRLKYWLESNLKLSPFQWGFRKGKHVRGACWRVVEAITSAIRTRDQIQAVALDIQAAYDSVWQNGLLAKMQRIGVPQYLVHWTRAFLSQRRSWIHVGHAAVECIPECGLPQGSPLSPTLFLIYINDLLQALTNTGVSYQAFADDIMIWHRGNFRNGDTAPEISLALKTVDQWAEKWRMTFNPHKCEAICFAGPRIQLEKQFQVGLRAGPIPTVGTLKYLGVWFDQGLLWHKQIRETTAGAKRLLWEMKKIVGERWGASPAVLLKLINQVVLPKLFFGAECWATVVRSERFLRSLDMVLGMGARMAFGLDRFCPTETALVIANLQPARYQILFRLCKFLIKQDCHTLTDKRTAAPPGTFLHPTKIANAWFQRTVIKRGRIPSPPPSRRQVLLPALKKGLLLEWMSRWDASPEIAAAKAAFPRVGQTYFVDRPRDRDQFSLLVRFLASDVYIGTLHLPRDDWYDRDCPICGDELSRRHVALECKGLATERRLLCRIIPQDRLDDWAWIVQFGEQAFGKFLLRVKARLVAAGHVGVCASDIGTFSSDA